MTNRHNNTSLWNAAIKATSIFIFSTNSLFAQDFDIKKYALGADLNFPSGITFADEGTDKLWIHYKTTLGGSIVDKLLKYEGENWAPMSFSSCSSCICDFKTGPEGSLWMAADSAGLFKRDGETWMKVLDTIALAIGWKEDGEMIIINGDGAFHYDGNVVTPGNSEGLPEITNPHDVVIDKTGDLYMILPSKLYLYNKSSGWTQKSDLSIPMNIKVDSENRVWVTDNFGEIGYYQEGIYQGSQYDYFGADGFDIDQNDVLWYSAEELVRNQNGAELKIEAEDLIAEAIFINSVYVDQNNLVWVASNFKSGIASVRYLGEPTSTTELPKGVEIKLSPNPVFDQTNLVFDLKENSKVEIAIYNIAGKIISSHENQLSAGHNVVPLNVSTLRNGIYLVNVSYGSHSKTLKMVKK